MNTLKLAAVACLGLSALSLTEVALAHGVNARQTAQQTRIQRGVATGELTRREAIALQTQQAHVARVEMRQRNDDGVLGPVERARLDALQDRASAAIWRQRHDAQRR